MINIGNFFALARAQLDRTNGIKSGDMTLVRVAGPDEHPTRTSRVRSVMGDLVPPNKAMRYAATCAWFGMAQPEHVLDIYESDDQIEAWARLVDAGAVTTVPKDAPCRTWAWAATARALGYDRLVTSLVHGRFESVLGPYTARFLADVRHLCVEPETGPWVAFSDAAHRGLAWVANDDGSEHGPELSRVVVSALLHEAGQHWPGKKLVDPWTVDSVVRWAEVCDAYVTARRAL